MVAFFDLDYNIKPTAAMMIMFYGEFFAIAILTMSAILLLFVFRREYPKKLALGLEYTQRPYERSELDSPVPVRSISASKKPDKVTVRCNPNKGSGGFLPSYPTKSPVNLSENSKGVSTGAKRDKSLPKDTLPSKELHVMYVTAKEHKSKSNSNGQGGASASESGTQSASSAVSVSKKRK